MKRLPLLLAGLVILCSATLHADELRPVSEDAAKQFAAALATDGQAVVTAWTDGAVPNQVYAVTFLPGGARSAPRRIHPTASSEQFRPEIAFNGSEYLVAWMEASYAGEGRVILMAKRLDRSGVAIEGSEIAIPAGNCVYGVALGTDGKDFLVAWDDHCQSSSYRMFAARISAGQAGAPRLLAEDPFGHDIGGMAWNGEHYLLVWRDLKQAPPICDGYCLNPLVRAAPLARNADVLAPGPLTISKEGARAGTPRVVWDGSQFAVFWVDYDLFAARVSPAGAVTPPVFVLPAGSSSPRIALAADGAEISVVWGRMSSTFHDELFVARGRLDSPAPFRAVRLTSGEDDLSPDLVATGNGSLALAFERGRQELGKSRVLFQSVSACPAPGLGVTSSHAEVAAGAAVTLTATAPDAVDFRWYRGASGTVTSPLPGTDGFPSIIVTPAQSTSYWVRAWSACGSFADSAAVTVAVHPCVAPSISQQPRDATVSAGGSAVLTVVAAGSTLTYQWFEGAVFDISRPVAGGNSPTLTTRQIASPTQFWVRVTTPCGTLYSDAAKVSVASTGRRRATGS